MFWYQWFSNGVLGYQKIKFDLQISYLFEIGNSFDDNVSFKGPFGIHISKNSRIYIADDLGHAFTVHDSNMRLLKNFDIQGNGPGEFSYPDCVITDDSGWIYVADTGNNRVQVLDPQGRYSTDIKKWNFFCSFENPRDLSFDSQGNLFITDWGNHCIRAFDRNLKFIKAIGKQGIGPGEFQILYA